MARLDIGKGLDTVIKAYQETGKKITPIMKQAVYPAAGYLAKKITAELQALPTVDGEDGKPPYAPPGVQLRYISSVQKKDLLNGFGISPFENKNVYINVKLGFDGYGSYPTKNWPNGIPNPLLIRSLCKGTKFLKKNDFISKLVRNETKNVEDMLDQKFNEILEKEL